MCSGEGQCSRQEALDQLAAYAVLPGMTGDSPSAISTKLAGCAEKTQATLDEEKKKAEQAAYMAASCDY